MFRDICFEFDNKKFMEPKDLIPLRFVFKQVKLTNGHKYSNSYLKMLTWIHMDEFNINNLPIETLQNLEKLIVRNNVNSHLPAMPNLKVLECLGDLYDEKTVLLREIPDCPRLEVCMVSFNHIRKIPRMEFCRKLCCLDSMVYEIEGLPRINKLYCDDNRIKKLPEMKHITLLNCSKNNITELPKMDKLKYLFCNENFIKEIPEYPVLNILHCAENELRSIAPSTTVEYLRYSQDQIDIDVKKWFPNVRVVQNQ